jgi:hypothetical protein
MPALVALLFLALVAVSVASRYYLDRKDPS